MSGRKIGDEKAILRLKGLSQQADSRRDPFVIRYTIAGLLPIFRDAGWDSELDQSGEGI